MTFSTDYVNASRLTVESGCIVTTASASFPAQKPDSLQHLASLNENKVFDFKNVELEARKAERSRRKARVSSLQTRAENKVT